MFHWMAVFGQNNQINHYDIRIVVFLEGQEQERVLVYLK